VEYDSYSMLRSAGYIKNVDVSPR